MGQNIAQQTTQQFRFNGLKWTIVLLFLALGVGANYYFSDVALAIRAAIGIVLICVLGLILLQTTKGQIAWGFIKAARGELRKVVWPARPEVVRTTMLVIGMVLLTGLVLWGIDSLFILGVTRIMGA